MNPISFTINSRTTQIRCAFPNALLLLTLHIHLPGESPSSSCSFPVTPPQDISTQAKLHHHSPFLGFCSSTAEGTAPAEELGHLPHLPALAKAAAREATAFLVLTSLGRSAFSQPWSTSLARGWGAKPLPWLYTDGSFIRRPLSHTSRDWLTTAEEPCFWSERISPGAHKQVRKKTSGPHKKLRGSRLA